MEKQTSREIEITLKVKVKKLSRESAREKDIDDEEFKYFDLEIVDHDCVKKVFEEYFDCFSISDDIPCTYGWPWEISKISVGDMK